MSKEQETQLRRATEAFYLDCEIRQPTPATLTWCRKYVGALPSRCVEAAKMTRKGRSLIDPPTIFAI